MNNTTIYCPVCGAEFSIAEHEHTVENATVIGKDSGLGAIPLPLDKSGKPGKADERLAALKAAGVDTSNLFAMRSASGEGMVVRIKDGVPEMVADDDPIYKIIISNGTIPDRNLFRRWIMAQMFAMLVAEDFRTGRKLNINEAIRRHGYEYQWRMLVEEMRVQSILFDKDKENFKMRNMWFNKGVCVDLAENYITAYMKHIEKLPKHNCKGVPYKRIGGKNIFESDIVNKVYWPLRRALENISRANTPHGLYVALKSFNHLRKNMGHNTPFSKKWIEAYKGTGAFFTMRNLIMFHGCLVHGERYNELYTKNTSLRLLDDKALEYSSAGEGWRMFAMMQKLIKDNGIDIEAKRKEWQDSKRNR